MAFHIKNPETDALARRVAALKKIGLTEAVHTALAHELEREQGKPTLVDLGVQFCRDFRARGNPRAASLLARRSATACTRIPDVH
ncbi:MULTISPECIES: type II toxin-antitoxin system VapB family antitoxin [Bradyrhizobium]|jgi:antitoxin VapB|uniref:Antitoxin VapB n=1 Tax=Bradyrhizobium elkanii TaxID=29448 RepID=A0ABV4ER65_BRAEL|nr:MULTISPECIES: type II toxin-antitoxin system VapB family antitoxin [Bradyrhizobium]MCP1758679.1 antitoxin VapB [Bradyrhizobium elkanii]MCP1975698.1 antitoxin VapB [Bradyrhizobium elkanii]MCP1984877.1 antitoxin VapB [Bradyrhizobium elkanii]MCS3890769.1 antitoxin VapB [Bradyrhizobium elkanii]MCS4113046.1 antitoxin VapB [Bradyrhizobium elkanii]